MISARELALKVLYEVESNKAYSNIELNKKFGEFNISQADKALATEIVYGVTKWKIKLDWLIEQISSIKLKKISPWILNILRIAIYQIDYLDKIPESAAVNESVILAKKYGHKGTIGFVNGVLRNYLRNKNTIKFPNKNDKVKYLSVVYSHPDWLIKRWLNLFDEDFVINLCESNNSTPKLVARVNTLKVAKEELLSRLKSEGIEAEDGLYFDEAVIINSNVNIVSLQSFQDGLFQIQDESSMLTAHILNPKPGQTVLDVCAAPGGKSTHIAQLMNNNGNIYSRDIHEHKIKLINESCSRLGITIIKSEIFDALKVDNSLIDKCDKVLVDAPCSGFGIIRRKPDIKYNREAEDKQSLVQIQQNILHTSAGYVKPGGTLIYSTCTIDDDENILLVKNFLKSHNKFILEDISDFVPKSLLKQSCKDGYIQTYPNIDSIDGFFVARMKRI